MSKKKCGHSLALLTPLGERGCVVVRRIGSWLILIARLFVMVKLWFVWRSLDVLGSLRGLFPCGC